MKNNTEFYVILWRELSRQIDEASCIYTKPAGPKLDKCINRQRMMQGRTSMSAFVETVL